MAVSRVRIKANDSTLIAGAVIELLRVKGILANYYVVGAEKINGATRKVFTLSSLTIEEIDQLARDIAEQVERIL